MATFALTNAVVYWGGADLTTTANKVTTTVSSAELDVTTFGSTDTTRIGGLKNVGMSLTSFQDYSGTTESSKFLYLGSDSFVPGYVNAVVFGPTGTDLSTAYFFNSKIIDMKLLDGAVGDAAATETTFVNATGNAATVPGLVRGVFLLPKKTTSSTGAESVFQLGAVGASQRLYASFHVFSGNAGATVAIQSSATSGGAYSDRITFTNPYSTVKSVAGAITDTWWRVNISAISGSYTFAIAVGIA